MTNKNKPLNTVSEVKKFLSTAKPNQKRSVGNNLYIYKNKNFGTWKLEASKVDIRGNKTRPTFVLGRFSTTPTGIDIQSLKPNKLNLLTLSQARDFAFKIKLDLAYNNDPNDENNDDKTFIDVKNDWVNSTKGKWTVGHLKEIERILGLYVYPYIGDIPVKNLNVGNFSNILQPIYDAKKYPTLKKVKGWCSNICDKAVAKEIIEFNPITKLKGDFKYKKSHKHFPTLKSINELPELINAINQSRAEPSTKACIFFIMYTFQRTNETRFAKWDEIDFNNRIWTIPNERMKASYRKFADGKDHIVPLSEQALEILNKQKQIESNNTYIFGAYRQRYDKPISSGTMLGLIKKVGFKDKMSIHGFRSLASTFIHDNHPEKTLVIEKQLSHADTNEMRKTYNNAEYMDLRVELMQFWADLVDDVISKQ